MLFTWCINIFIVLTHLNFPTNYLPRPHWMNTVSVVSLVPTLNRKWQITQLTKNSNSILKPLKCGVLSTWDSVPVLTTSPELHDHTSGLPPPLYYCLSKMILLYMVQHLVWGVCEVWTSHCKPPDRNNIKFITLHATSVHLGTPRRLRTLCKSLVLTWFSIRIRFLKHISRSRATLRR